jgi:hypothetical protein
VSVPVANRRHREQRPLVQFQANHFERARREVRALRENAGGTATEVPPVPESATSRTYQVSSHFPKAPVRAFQRGATMSSLPREGRPLARKDVACGPFAQERLRKALDEVVQPGYNSQCLICGHLFYGATMSSCSRCGGKCVIRSDHDLQLMGRRSLQLIEAEK